jgi:hypothetical protein
MAKSTSPPKAKAAKASNKPVAKASKPSKNPPGSKAKKDKIFRFICEQHVMGITEVDVMNIALAVGNKNVRSEGFTSPLKELGEVDGLITKGNGKVSLTEHGIKAIPDDLEISNDPSKIHDRYIEFIETKAKLGKDKVHPLWQILMYWPEHRINDLAKELGYGNPRSFANTKIVAAMKEASLVEGKGVIKFTDKVPRV